MKILVIAAHPDDEILGLGGTLLKHWEQGDEVYIAIVTKSYAPEWPEDYMRSKLEEAKVVDNIMGVKKRFYCDFPTVKLNTVPHGEIAKKISQIVEEVSPDVVYTHFEHDVNEDHQIIFRAVLVATRPTAKKMEMICFETPSSTEWGSVAFKPNHYIDIAPYLETKIKAFGCYASEVKDYPHPRSPEGLRKLAEQRGLEACMKNAEAFLIIRSYG